MPGREGKHILQAAWSGVQAALYPEAGCDADLLRAFEEEAQESNARLLRWGAWVGVPANALPLVVLLRHPGEDPAGAAWVFWLVSVSTFNAAFLLLAAIVARRRRPRLLWRSLGDVAGVMSLVGTAARSANAQRAHPNITLFVAAAFATALVLRMRPRVFVLALLGAAALVLAGMIHFRADAPGLLADEISLLINAALGIFGFFFARSMRVREIVARWQIERLNRELVLRLAEQARDIAERRRVEEALREAKVAAEAADRTKSAFLANMSHEIRTPMNAILGRAQLLQRDPGLAPDQKQHLDAVLRSGDHLLDLINNVLEMSRVEVGFHPLDLGGVDLRRVIDDLARVFGRRAEEKRLSFAIDEAPGLPRHIAGDEPRLRQVLASMLGNAVKFTERGGIVLRVRPRPGDGEARLLLEVEDTGPGIEATEVSGLFRPFAQVQVGIHGRGGAGLGLALSREFAQRMDGDLTVESQPGVGSVFRLEIPLILADRAPVSAPPRSEPAPAAPSPGAVLRAEAAALPAGLLAELSAALRAADYESLVDLASRFPADHETAASALRALVEDYRYDDIAAALAPGLAEVREPAPSR